MADRAHIRNGILIRSFAGERGRITLETGDTVSPVLVGFESGNDKVVPYVTETVDNSTGPDTITSHETVVEATQVIRRTTIVNRPIADWRDTATLTRRQFCLACLQAGLLTPDDAMTAASGGWPASFDAALAGLSAMEVAAAKVEWAAVGTIRRNAPLLVAVQAVAGVTDAQLDALFGWVG